MKKIIVGVLVLLIGMTLPVKAANYEMRELIPSGITTTIRGETFLYKGLSYKNGIIKFETIKNNSKEKKSLSISIGLFDEKKKNVGTINFCSSEMALDTKEEKPNFVIDVKGSNLETGKSYQDIKYISVLGENENCRVDGSTDYIGQTVEQIGMPKNNTFNDEQLLLINIVKVIVIGLVAWFLYRFLFTTAFRNMDGEDVRQEYAYINKELRNDRERELKKNPPKPKEVKKVKSDAVIEQEKIQNEKDKEDDSDLHNFYK